MDFIEAVRELKDGRCKGITTEGGQVFILVDGGRFLEAVDSPNALRGPSKVDAILDDWSLFDPHPVTEEVEVKRWAVVAPSGLVYDTFSCLENAKKNSLSVSGSTIVELTGTHTREVKPKTKRREEVPHTGKVVTASGIDVPFSVSRHVFVEWED